MASNRPVPLRGERNIWRQLTQQIDELPWSGNGRGLWDHITPDPGGLWRELRHETVLLVRDRRNIWQQVDDETLILARAVRVNLWEAVRESLQSRAPSKAADADIWLEIEDETFLLDRPEESIWDLARVRNIAHLKPTRLPGWALKKLTTSGGEEYYVLKSLHKEVYLRLDKRQVFLWERMDGEYSVQDLAAAFFIEYQRLSIDWLMGFLSQLQMKGFVVEEKHDLYRESRDQLQQRTVGVWVKRILKSLLRSQLWVEGIDGFFATLYRTGGWLLFTLPAQIVILLIALAGIPAFFYLSQRGGFTPVTGTISSSLGTGLLGLLVAEIFAVFTHEAAHALTVKHYGRTVRRGGLGLYFGMLSFFVDTTDIWMEPRRPRLAVTWAGPYSGLLLGGAASLALLSNPGPILAGMMYQFATFCYGISLVNVNPLLKLDGYYLLMDWLEIPRLREQSVQFVRSHLWDKLRQRQAFSRQERIFAIFGLLSLIWMGITLTSMARLYGGGLYRLAIRIAGKL